MSLHCGAGRAILPAATTSASRSSRQNKTVRETPVAFGQPAFFFAAASGPGAIAAAAAWGWFPCEQSLQDQCVSSSRYRHTR